MSNKNQISAMAWDDSNPRAKRGDGISRPMPGARTRPYTVRIKGLPGALKVTLNAETKRHAVKYAKARWPGSTVEVEK